MLPTQERLQELFRFNPKTGQLIRKVTRGRSAAGAVVGDGVRNNGYLKVKVDEHRLNVHNVIWALLHGYWPYMLRHIDGNVANNQLCNLKYTAHSSQENN